MSEERKDEKWCVSHMMVCPVCDSGDIYYDNEEVNEWGEFQDAHCLNCGYWWCEIVGFGDDDDDDMFADDDHYSENYYGGEFDDGWDDE